MTVFEVADDEAWSPLLWRTPNLTFCTQLPCKSRLYLPPTAQMSFLTSTFPVLSIQDTIGGRGLVQVHACKRIYSVHVHVRGFEFIPFPHLRVMACRAATPQVHLYTGVNTDFLSRCPTIKINVLICGRPYTCKHTL